MTIELCQCKCHWGQGMDARGRPSSGVAHPYGCCTLCPHCELPIKMGLEEHIAKEHPPAPEAKIALGRELTPDELAEYEEFKKLRALGFKMQKPKLERRRKSAE